jgi:hypothetical protein
MQPLSATNDLAVMADPKLFDPEPPDFEDRLSLDREEKSMPEVYQFVRSTLAENCSHVYDQKHYRIYRLKE